MSDETGRDIADIVGEYLGQVNSEPELQSLLWDVGLLPEQITSKRDAVSMVAVCVAFQRNKYEGITKPSGAQDAIIRTLQARVAELEEQLNLGPLGRMGLSLRTRKALRKAGITTVDALRAAPEADLLRLPNLGRKGLLDIRAALNSDPDMTHADIVSG